MWKCNSCGEENGLLNRKCYKCGTPKADSTASNENIPKDPNQQPKGLWTKFKEMRERNLQSIDKPYEPPPQSPKTEPSSQSFFIESLKVCGFLDLVAGIFGALYIWSLAPSYTRNGNGIYAAIAIAVAFQGFVVFVFFNVFAGIAENLVAIRDKRSDKQE